MQRGVSVWWTIYMRRVYWLYDSRSSLPPPLPWFMGILEASQPSAAPHPSTAGMERGGQPPLHKMSFENVHRAYLCSTPIQRHAAFAMHL